MPGASSETAVLQAQATRAGIITCKHNVYNEFDFTSDVARWFKIRHVPSFLVFVDGALVERCVLPDSRGRTYAPSNKVCCPCAWTGIVARFLCLAALGHLNEHQSQKHVQRGGAARGHTIKMHNFSKHSQSM